MRLAIVYGPSATNDFLVGSLAHHAPALVIREHQPASRVLWRAWRRRRDPLGARLNKLAFFALYGAWLGRSVEHRLHERLDPHPPPPDGPIVESLADARELVRRARVELVLVVGTSILSAEWQTLGVPIVNLHVGIAPRYRGRFCWFWPVIEHHVEDIGVTLHQVSARVDAGPVLIQRRAARSELGELSFAELLTAVTRLGLEVCEEFLASPERYLLSSAPAPIEPSPRPAYLEPGLTEYLRFVREAASEARVDHV